MNSSITVVSERFKFYKSAKAHSTFFASCIESVSQYLQKNVLFLQVLFKKELDKVYDPNAPEDDMREREEEMERMREHVFRESDTDKNKLISFDEFLAETKREEFEKDPGTVFFIDKQ